MSSHYIRAATDARLLKRGCESLLGICAGLIADGQLNDLEIRFLRMWLIENSSISATWPGEVIHQRISDVLSDGVISEEERSYLLKTLEQLVGGSFVEEGAIPANSSTLGIDEGVNIVMTGKSFCFTGQFLYGTRNACERVVTQRGGIIKSVSKNLDYLVLGELSSHSWKYTSFGNKIDAAIELKNSGIPLLIVSEAQWVQAL